MPLVEHVSKSIDMEMTKAPALRKLQPLGLNVNCVVACSVQRNRFISLQNASTESLNDRSLPDSNFLLSSDVKF